LCLTSPRGNRFIAIIGHAGVPREFDFMTKPGERADGRARHVGVQEEAHDELGGGKRMKRFLVGKIGDELQGSANIVNREIVLTLNLFEGHATSQADGVFVKYRTYLMCVCER
jgi:hypothetical protein